MIVTGVRKDWFCQDCRVQMIYDKHNDRHICPKCYAELWHSSVEDKHVSDEITKLMQEKYKSNLPPKDPIPAGEAAKGGGVSKSKGRDRKGLMQKKSLAKLNEGLNGKDMRFESR